LNKKIILIVIAVLLFFAGLIAATQEAQAPVKVQANTRKATESVPVEEPEEIIGGINASDYTVAIPDWIKPARWFKSNQGGMVIEEMLKDSALRNEYALVVYFTQKDKLPGNLLPFYNNDFFIEVRVLYKHNEVERTQWIFRDIKGTTRFLSVIVEPSKSVSSKDDKKIYPSGFMETYDENSFITAEYKFLENGNRDRIDYIYNNGMLITSTFFSWEEGTTGGGEYRRTYADFLRYNRSFFLRYVERVYYQERKISFANEQLRFSFPRNIKDAAKPQNLMSEKANSYPEFFGNTTIYKNERIVYTTDERSRILSQTLYDEKNNVVWVIRNTWLNGRIVSTLKTESGTESLAEYEYDSDGNRVLEKNYKNGVLERVVRTEGNTDIEDLYFNNVAVLRAIWKDGRKISETRINKR
jgi:antitoxin component YwqK of YwqJK toxin-antitoxin module